MPVRELDRGAALLVLDIQPLTLANARSISPAELLDRVLALVDAFRRTGRPVVFGLSTGIPPGRTDVAEHGRSWPPEAVRLAPGMEPHDDEPVLPRAAWSAFHGTQLAAHLSTWHSPQLVITGMATSFGVESTARAAYDLGLDVVVVVDAVADPDLDAHESATT